MCHLSMVEFDDKAPLELLELVNRVFSHLDKSHEGVNMQKETQEKTEERICGFLKVLGYPCDFNPNYCRDIVHGEKKTLHHILYWLLSRLPDLQRKAYTAKFLVPLMIPDEYKFDEEMNQINQIYKDL
jgi:intraflagellar transport protein 81